MLNSETREGVEQNVLKLRWQRLMREEVIKISWLWQILFYMGHEMTKSNVLHPLILWIKGKVGNWKLMGCSFCVVLSLIWTFLWKLFSHIFLRNYFVCLYKLKMSYIQENTRNIYFVFQIMFLVKHEMLPIRPQIQTIPYKANKVILTGKFLKILCIAILLISNSQMLPSSCTVCTVYDLKNKDQVILSS